MKLRQTICKELKIIRQNLRIGQKSLSFDLDIAPQGYGRIERCEQGLTVDQLEDIADLLGYSITFKIVKK